MNISEKTKKKFRIRISQEEHLHLLDVAGFERSVTTAFGPSGVYITEEAQPWVIEEIARLRDISL